MSLVFATLRSGLLDQRIAFSICTWDIYTSRIRFQVITRNPISTSALTTAYIAIAANAAATFEFFGATQIGKQLRVAIDLHDIICADITRCNRQKARGLNPAHLPEEAESVSI